MPAHAGEPALAGVGHGALAEARPSALHVLRAVAPAHVDVPGVQTHEVQVVPAQVDEPGQVSVVLLNPSALHARTVRASTHDDAPGVHARAWHTPALQRCDAVQAIGRFFQNPHGMPSSRTKPSPASSAA